MEPDEDAAWVEELDEELEELEDLDELEGDDGPDPIRRADPVGERTLFDRAGRPIGEVHWEPSPFWLNLTVERQLLGLHFEAGQFSQRTGWIRPEWEALVREQAPETAPVFDLYPLGVALLGRERRDEIRLTVDQRFSYRQSLYWMFDRPDLGLEDCELFDVPFEPSTKYRKVQNRLWSLRHRFSEQGFPQTTRDKVAQTVQRLRMDKIRRRLLRLEEPMIRSAGGLGEVLTALKIRSERVELRLALQPFPDHQVRLVRRPEPVPEGRFFVTTRYEGTWADGRRLEKPWLVDDHLIVCFGQLPDEFFLSVSPGASGSP